MPTTASSSRTTWFARTLRVACLAMLFGLALISTPRPGLGQSADFNNCLSGCDSVCAAGPESLRFECKTNCNMRCVKESQAVPATPAPHGSIAFGDGGAEGISWHNETTAEADKIALSICSKSGSNCKVVYRFQNSCAALAKTPDNRHIEVATGATEQLAEQNATVVCQGRWGQCSSDLSACSFTSGGVRANTPAPPNVVSWAAIAFSAADGQAGWSSTKISKAVAEQEALATCAKRGKACAVVSSFNKQCGALARGGSVYGTAVSEDQPTALHEALQECTKNGGSRCAVQVLFCSR